jgi:acyl-lipid omega-6 desaturase (Delta-12 desaturase)
MVAHAQSTEPVRPRDVDDRARSASVGIGDVRDLIPKECYVISPWRSWSALAMAFARIAVAEAILFFIEPRWGTSLVWQIPALAAAWLFAGWALTGLFVIGHDCAHMAFSTRRWVNELVGHVALSLEFTGFHNWRIWHNFHHAKTQLRAVDPDWAEKMMTRAEYETAPLGEKAHVRLGFGTPLGLLVGFWVGMFRRTFMKTLAPQIPLTRGAGRELFMSSVFMFATVAAVSWLLVRLGGTWAVLKYYYVPAFIAAAHGAMLTYLHHTSPDALVFDREGWTPFRGQVVSTFNVRFPAICEAMWFDINIHLPHHLAPKIPWYHLKPAAEAIREARPELYIERQFSFSYLRACWARPLLSRTPGEQYFEMTSFGATEPASADEAGAHSGA